MGSPLVECTNFKPRGYAGTDELHLWSMEENKAKQPWEKHSRNPFTQMTLRSRKDMCLWKKAKKFGDLLLYFPQSP